MRGSEGSRGGRRMGGGGLERGMVRQEKRGGRRGADVCGGRG
jgi:hypothetical protein